LQAAFVKRLEFPAAQQRLNGPSRSVISMHVRALVSVVNQVAERAHAQIQARHHVASPCSIISARSHQRKRRG
jgi:hypothetical protein